MKNDTEQLLLTVRLIHTEEKNCAKDVHILCPQ